MKITSVETEYFFDSSELTPRILLNLECYTVAGKKYSSIKKYVPSVHAAIKETQGYFGKINARVLDDLNLFTKFGASEMTVEIKATNPLT